MSFHEIRFPASLSFGALGGPERRTQIVTLANGFEERNTPWAHSRRRYDAGLGLRSLEDVETLIAFFEARQGPLIGFRWKDWADFKSCAAGSAPAHGDQQIGIGDGAQRVFALCKTYRSGPAQYSRPITKPVAGSVRLALADDPLREGVHYTLDPARGTVTLEVPPPLGVQLTAGFEFDVPARFDTDIIRTSVANFQAGEVPDVPVIEVRT
ncbi:DUF2460 domain-containing protein [Profundibacterium mesophilum]|uniref:DUF2460 domain-containing protein n=1 Tax=Profundibacterium mesophilum KAUST100406-0324 TaxID=1037889 RepID=A0A921NR30_9RHOB|nr:DUF2460 domain-containing protein [Profundibacterium mesophilum]KAF0677421.1 hypothetical protein PMES_00207 [Profundibacterium mesophilum KAUST100406-0324]